ncbi:hypothetical protein L1887_14665 [Cichorium endivia]|nr:hypothetical protein L1887_14665 [Cichorium endivia]
MPSSHDTTFEVQSFPPQNFTLLGDSYLRHGVAGLILESNFLSASSGTKVVRFSGNRTNSSASFSFSIILRKHRTSPRIKNLHNATVIRSPLVGFGVDSSPKKYRKLIGLGVEVSGTALFLAILAFLGYISVMKIKPTKNLEKILGNFGRIHSCKIAKDDLGKIIGKFVAEESANDTLTALDGTTFDGTMIPVAKKSEPEVYEKNLDSDFTQIETFSCSKLGSKDLLDMKKSKREGFAHKKHTTTSFDDEMLELDMNPISIYDDGLRLHEIRLSFSDDGLHDSRETTVIDDDSVDSETVGSFCTMSQVLVHWRSTEEEAIYNYFISNIAAYVPTVQQKGKCETITNSKNNLSFASAGERYISKVKALEAGKAAKRHEDKKEKERRMKKDAFKMERERVKKEKEREMELNRKIKEEEMKKKEADMAARKKPREKEERAKKRKEEKRWRL